MPLPSRGQSTVCAWHEFGLTNKSAEWNVVLEGFKQPCTSNTVHAYGRILFKFSTTKNGRVITLEVLYEETFTWLYGNDFYDISLLPIVTGELFVKLVR